MGKLLALIVLYGLLVVAGIVVGIKMRRDDDEIRDED